jgi:transcriptional repressor NrdR
MFCVNCLYPTTSVKNSRSKKNAALVWRRRFCSRCGRSFTTQEFPSLRDNKPVSNAHRLSPFNLGKLIISISKAFPHSKHDAEFNSFELARSVENQLSTEREYITTDDIAAITHSTLKRFDQLAGMHYAMSHGLVTSVRKRGRPSLAWHDQ